MISSIGLSAARAPSFSPTIQHCIIERSSEGSKGRTAAIPELSCRLDCFSPSPSFCPSSTSSCSWRQRSCQVSRTVHHNQSALFSSSSSSSSSFFGGRAAMATRERKVALVQDRLPAMAFAGKTDVIVDESDGNAIGVTAKLPQPHMFPYQQGGSDASLSEFSTMADLSSAMAEYITELSAMAIRERDAFTVVLSGGSLVKALVNLTLEPALSAVDWSKWHVFWADERLVPLSHPDSNYKLAKEEFLAKVPIPESQVYALDDSLDVDGAANAYESVLRELVGSALTTVDVNGKTYPQFDLILLGMGPDGHIASLFPNHPLVAEEERWVMPITNSPKPPPKRITLTLPVINSARNIAFVAAGGGKAEVLQRVLEVQALPGALPAQMVRPYTGRLVWFADKDATSSLSVDQWSDPKHFPRNDLKKKK